MSDRGDLSTGTAEVSSDNDKSSAAGQFELDRSGLWLPSGIKLRKHPIGFRAPPVAGAPGLSGGCETEERRLHAITEDARRILGDDPGRRPMSAAESEPEFVEAMDRAAERADGDEAGA